MSDVIGRGVIEVSADSSKLNATIAEARARLKGLGEAGKDSAGKASASIDKYIKTLENQNATLGKSKREIELYKLALKGASDEQLRAANAALKVRDAFEAQAKKTEAHAARMGKVKDALKGVGVGLAGLAGLAGGFSIAGVMDLAKGAGDFQDLSERVGESSQALASMAVSAKVGGVEMSEVGDAIVKLNKNLSGVDDESAAAGKALAALGLNVRDLKEMSGADQLEAIAKAFNEFEDSSTKSTVALTLFSKGGDKFLSFLKELGNEGGRQVILTKEQIELADDYADKQAKSRAQIYLHSQALATKLLPAISQFTEKLAEMAKNEDTVAAVTSTLKGVMSFGITVFQGFAVAGANVAFVVRGIAREMDGLKRITVALAHGDFAGVKSIAEEVKAGAVTERAQLETFVQGIRGLSPADIPTIAGSGKKAEDAKDEPPKKKRKLKYDPPDDADAKARKAEAAQKAKAQTELDVEIIKQGSEKILNTYANQDRILSSRRQANMIDENTYYAGKTKLIQLEADEQERALNAEIARYEKENLTGKERLKTEKKIEETRGKLAKVREDEAVQLELNANEQAASMRKIAQAYLDAATAAQTYIDTIKRQNARIVAGVGQGQKFRERQDGTNAIEDKLIDRKGELDSELRKKDITADQYAVYLQVAKDTYSEEVRLFNERTDAIDRKQADGFNGMTEALHNYADEARNVAGQFEGAFNNALTGLEDSFVKLATTGKGSFKELLQSIQADIARIGFRTLIGKGIDSLFAGSSLEKLFGRTPKTADSAKGAQDVLNGLAGAKDGAGDGMGQAGQAAALAGSKLALEAQALAATNAKTSLENLGIAADKAASSLSPTVARGGPVSVDSSLPGLPGAESPATDAQAAASDTAKTQAKAQVKAADSANVFGGEAISAANDLVKLASAAGIGGDAMARLPGIIAMIQAAAAANTASNSAGLLGKIAGLFGGGGVASSAEYAELDLLAAAEGGYIKGPGTGTSDSIPARLSNGEYVMPAKQTAAYLPLLEQMRDDDLRHTGKAGVSVIARIMAESRHSGKNGGTLGAVKGGRAIGGPVSAGGLYRVNERGPELLHIAGKQFLMMGQHGGRVEPNAAPAQARAGGDTYVNVSVAPPAGASRATALQFGAAAARQMQLAMRRNG
jgi:lambda family phage tail tape measure protein